MHPGVMDNLAIIIAKYFIVLPILLALITLIDIERRREQLRFVALLVASGILSLVLAKIGGHLINDPRPYVIGHFTPLVAHSADNGFPSDHVLLASLLSWTVLRYSRNIGIASLVIAALIGAARMKVGVHHLEDVIGSFVITGIAILVVSFAMSRILRNKHDAVKS